MKILAILLAVLLAGLRVDAHWCEFHSPETSGNACGGCGYVQVYRDFGASKPYTWLSYCPSSWYTGGCFSTTYGIYNTCGSGWSGNPKCCPINCSMNSWGSWSSCSRSCGGGSKTRTRTRKQTGSNGGLNNCPSSQTQSSSCNTQCCAVSCSYSWGSWSSCSKSCGGGTQSRSPSISRYNSCGGTSCPSSQTRSCNTGCCVVNCVYTWSSWSSCTRSCGSGTQSRSPIVSRSASCGGSCPSSTSRSCNTSPCPINCVTSNWSSWSSCSYSASCGVTGSKSRSRSIVTYPQYNGASCPSLTSTSTCALINCPVHCLVSDWSVPGPCSATACGTTGTQLSTRVVTQYPLYGGNACPTLQMTTPCSASPCPVDCTLNAWSSWSVCSVTACGLSGTQTRTRTVAQAPLYGGTPCDALDEAQACSTNPCPVDCAYSQWSQWSACTYGAACGVVGTSTRSRIVTQEALHGGLACPTPPPVTESQSCALIPCPIDCAVSSFSAPSSCSASVCGTNGTTVRSRIILTQPAHGGAVCPNLELIEPCSAPPCPVDCALSSWSSWSVCSTLECGTNGTTERTRMVETAPAHGGLACQALAETVTCENTPCPIGCNVSQWSDWSSCNATVCGSSGVHERTRVIIQEAAYNGTACPEILSQTLACVSNQSCPINCTLNEWSLWSSCTYNSACGVAGVQTRNRTVLQEPLFGGEACATLNDSTECAALPCPIDCEMSPFGAPTECTAPCGGTANQTRTRVVLRKAAYGGVPCPSNLTLIETCNGPPCPVNCTVSSFSMWSSCSVSACGSTGTIERSRNVTVAPLHGGQTCPTLLETDTCETAPCPIDCVQSMWTMWSACNTTCGLGVQLRSRVTVTPSAHGGLACGPVNDSQSCNVTATCPVDCVVSDFGEWSSCNNTCGDGTRRRDRIVTRDAQFGGMACPTLQEASGCTDNSTCPVNCELTSWSSYGQCNTTCGEGVRLRTRSVVLPAAYGGVACPGLDGLSDETACTANSTCAVDCVLTEWSVWDVCSLSCGNGTTYRLRDIATHPQNGGEPCAPLIESQSCNELPCAVDCVMSEPVTGSCTATCAPGGLLNITRDIMTAPAHGGAPCPYNTTVTEPCETTTPCPIDCGLSSWSTYSACSAPFCGGGNQTRTRSVTRSPDHGGLSCPPPSDLSETQPCNTHACPTQCQVPWTNWTSCSSACNGFTLRSLDLTNFAGHTGICNSSVEVDFCNLGLPPCGLPPPITQRITNTSVNSGAIAGAVIGSMLILTIVVFVGLRHMRRQKHKIVRRESMANLPESLHARRAGAGSTRSSTASLLGRRLGSSHSLDASGFELNSTCFETNMLTALGQADDRVELDAGAYSTPGTAAHETATYEAVEPTALDSNAYHTSEARQHESGAYQAVGENSAMAAPPPLADVPVVGSTA